MKDSWAGTTARGEKHDSAIVMGHTLGQAAGRMNDWGQSIPTSAHVRGSYCPSPSASWASTWKLSLDLSKLILAMDVLQQECSKPGSYAFLLFLPARHLLASHIIWFNNIITHGCIMTCFWYCEKFRLHCSFLYCFLVIRYLKIHMREEPIIPNVSVSNSIMNFSG